MLKSPDDPKVTGLCLTTEVTKEILLIAAFCGVAFAVLVDDGLVFCIAENDCVVFSCVGLCACHKGLLLSLHYIYRKDFGECKVKKEKSPARDWRFGG